MEIKGGSHFQQCGADNYQLKKNKNDIIVFIFVVRMKPPNQNVSAR